VPCGASTKVFKPGDKLKARARFGLPERCDFLATMVAANKDPQDRKGFSEALVGFAKFIETRPDAFLYLHTNWSGPINIAEIVRNLKIENNVVMCDQYDYLVGNFDEAHMVAVYQASDVLLNPCKAEGFGLPIVEAQMCGCPVIAADFATTDELLFAGWKLKGQRDWGYGADSFRLRVFVDEVTAALEEAYKNKSNDELRRRAANESRKHDLKLIFETYWKPALAEIEKLVTTARFATVGLPE
jgi:glycosyltransferase involved in cell wall biosynthesis